MHQLSVLPLFSLLLFLIRAMAAASSTLATVDKRLVIHMDINKCIIIQDPVKGFSIDDSLNSILSEVIWGEIDPSLPGDELDRWRLISTEPSIVPPTATAISYASFLETKTNLQRAARRPLIRGFTGKGGKGEGCMSAFERLKRAMTIPGIYPEGGDMNKKRKLEDLSTISEATRQALGNQGFDNHYHIVPSFFRLMKELYRRKSDFKIIFRTFGSDLAKISNEINLFCEGKHSLFPLEEDELQGMSKYSISTPSSSLRIIRTGPLASDIHVAYVSDENVLCSKTGALEVYDVIQEKLNAKDTCVIGVQDDFQYWYGCKESCDSGKLMLVNSDSHSDHNDDSDDDDDDDDDRNRDIHIFFDDNIELDRAHIVDVRELWTFEPIPFHISQGKFIQRVDPMLVIEDEFFFVKKLEEVLRKHYNCRL